MVSFFTILYEGETEVSSQLIVLGDEYLQYSHVNLYRIITVCVGLILRAGTAQVLLISVTKGSFFNGGVAHPCSVRCSVKVAVRTHCRANQSCSC